MVTGVAVACARESCGGEIVGAYSYLHSSTVTLATFIYVRDMSMHMYCLAHYEGTYLMARAK